MFAEIASIRVEVGLFCLLYSLYFLSLICAKIVWSVDCWVVWRIAGFVYLDFVECVGQCLRSRQDLARSGKVEQRDCVLSLVNIFFYSRLVNYCGDLDSGCRERHVVKVAWCG